MRQITALIFLVVLPALAAAAPPKRAARQYWLAECSSNPFALGTQAGNWTVFRAKVRRKTRTVYARHSDGRTLALVVRRLGQRVPGWTTGAVYGPAMVRLWMARHVACRGVKLYTQAHTYPAAIRNWVAARSVCYGSADWTIEGKTARVRRWPCTAEGVSVIRLDGYRPRVKVGR